MWLTCQWPSVPWTVKEEKTRSNTRCGQIQPTVSFQLTCTNCTLSILMMLPLNTFKCKCGESTLKRGWGLYYLSIASVLSLLSTNSALLLLYSGCSKPVALFHAGLFKLTNFFSLCVWVWAHAYVCVAQPDQSLLLLCLTSNSERTQLVVHSY